jgi:hypothetical protein
VSPWCVEDTEEYTTSVHAAATMKEQAIAFAFMVIDCNDLDTFRLCVTAFRSLSLSVFAFCFMTE